MELRLTEAQLAIDSNWDRNGYDLKFTLTSLKPQDIGLTYNLGDSISATDNNDRNLFIGVISANPRWYGFETNSVVLHSGETITLLSLEQKSISGSVYVEADTGGQTLTEIRVTVSISGINNATWRIPVYH